MSRHIRPRLVIKDGTLYLNDRAVGGVKSAYARSDGSHRQYDVWTVNLQLYAEAPVVNGHRLESDQTLEFDYRDNYEGRVMQVLTERVYAEEDQDD